MAAPILIVRCPKCTNRFKLHNWTGAPPICPICTTEVADKLDMSKPIKIAQGGSPMAQAVRIAQDVAERDYGLTDMRTGVDPGEIVAPKMTKDQQVMDKAWKQAATWNAPQRFPGLAPGQSWMDAARAATSATGQASANTITKISRGLKANPMNVQTIDADTGRLRIRKI